MNDPTETGTKIYGIAMKSRECGGHGDFYEETKIVPRGPYHSGAFPPFFKTKEEADVAALHYGHPYFVVELKLF